MGVELFTAQYTGPITTWEARDQETGVVKCSFSVDSPLKDCIDGSASAPLICSGDPVAFTAANESTTSFIVESTPPEGNPAIIFYEVETKCGHGCSIPAGGQNLHCLLTGLEPATSYIIRARACLLGEGDCSGYINTTAITRPKGIVSECLLFQS